MLMNALMFNFAKFLQLVHAKNLILILTAGLGSQFCSYMKTFKPGN